ncbi:MAG: glycosyltransferase, partial [Solirubrobacterales bacterium]
MPAAKRFLLVAIGEAGHAFPMIAIGRQLRARGHEVAIHTWVRWQQHVETEDMAFFKAPVFVHAPYAPAPNVHQAAALATDELLEVVRGYRPDVIVSDILTLAGSLAAEKSGTPHATFVPHFWHVT